MAGLVYRFLCVLVLFWACPGCHPLQSEPPYTLTGTWHTVSRKDTLARIARKYRVSVRTLEELNDVADNRMLQGREAVFVPRPGGKRPGEGRPWGAGTVSSSTPARESATGSRSATSIRAGCGDGHERPCLLWPIEGKLAARFGTHGGSPHDGIDIRAVKGTVIRAAAAGDVIYSGDQIKGYGNLVIIRHRDGLITVYAHNDRNRVKEGQSVARGEAVAEVGQSGSAKAPHLHFEVRKAEKPVDPINYLP
jgi:murein DD-endopeptidase MepM/ murein hydrolase activator NlpD